MEENRIEVDFEDSSTPEEAAAAQRQSEQFDRNIAWMQEHILEIGQKYRGKCICIAGQELFAGDTTTEALAQATTVHPEDRGLLNMYIHKEKAARVYALRR